MTDGITDVNTPDEEQVVTDDSNVTTDDYEQKYKELQGEFTRKSQRLAELEKQQQALETKSDTKEGLSTDEAQLLERIQGHGFVRESDLTKKLTQTKLENSFNQLLQNYPDLKKHEPAIRDLQKSNGGSFEEVAIQYGFTTQDKLERAMSSRDKMVGNHKTGNSQKSIADMSPDEYDKWKKDNGVGYSSGLTKAT